MLEALVTIATALIQSPDNLASRPYLTLDAAQAGAAACRATADENDWRVAITIIDRGGNVVLFERMDDVFETQSRLSRLKAATAATTPVGTAALREAAFADRSPIAGIEHVPGIVVIEGGEPIIVAEPEPYPVGGVGVSGARPDQDGTCAKAAAAAASQALRG
ncbi:GlcG/HbpS family heme-binding protein [Parvularcula maris]|uniref:Heme-binding protein n=1 Tax=Parvularcula maris TaxID=2965077 RepID=A0A9X2LBE6_9PROT|nr:heme-binding protein [Parvularcula maris]MCQ8186638.1 heme-binding protein [Parvularcula maris]